MPIEAYSDELQAEIVKHSKGGMSGNKIALAMNLSRSGVQNALKRAARRGEFGPVEALPGFEISRLGQRVDKTGAVIGQSIEQKPERGGAFNLPDGHSLKGVSALVGADGRVSQQWFKTGRVPPSPEEIAAQFKAAAEAYRGYARLPSTPLDCDEDLSTVYPVADLHFGMYAWGEETGEDWDCDIAEREFRAAFGKLIRRAPSSKRAAFLGLGDFFHADNFENQTNRSRHALDVDTRFPRVQWRGALLLRMAVEMLAAKHELVTVRILPGNHDDHSAYHLGNNMRAFFDGHERVTIDADPSRLWFHRFGVNLFGAGHGDQAKPKDAAAILASHRPEDWGASRYRHWYSGHLHNHQKGGTSGGATWEIMETIIPKDAYSAAHGYHAGRSLVCDTCHVSEGPILRTRVNIASTPSRREAA